MDHSLKKTLSTTVFGILIAVISWIGLAHGATANPTDPQSIGLPFEGKDSATSIAMIIKTVIKYIGILAILSLTWGGLEFVISGGEDGKIKKAKGIITYSLIGVVVAVSAYAIIDIVANFKIN